MVGFRGEGCSMKISCPKCKTYKIIFWKQFLFTLPVHHLSLSRSLFLAKGELMILFLGEVRKSWEEISGQPVKERDKRGAFLLSKNR